MATLLLGQTLTFVDDPFHTGIDAAAKHERRGAVLVEDGTIVALGTAETLLAEHPQAALIDYGSDLITAGFVDAHAHYAQTAIIASWGKRLIDWLNSYTFPEELRFSDPDYAAAVAAQYFDLILAHGTTTVCSYGTVHPESVDAFFAEAQRRDMRVIAGKSCMDRNAPDGLTDTPERAHDESAALIKRWHGKDRLGYAITPRFTPTSTEGQLTVLGQLWQANPTCLMQTHLSEQEDEVAWVRTLVPTARDYLDTYEQHGLLGPGAVFGHAIHLTPSERARIKESGAALVHCPTSNTFIGSGIFDMAGLVAEGQRIGLATDTGGGSSFSMLRTMAAAYELSQLNGRALHPAELYWLATQGSARALRLENQVGALAPGMEADLVVLNLASTPAIAQRADRAEAFWDSLFPTIMMGDDRAIRDVWIHGARYAAA